jgi:hypothetical protein
MLELVDPQDRVPLAPLAVDLDGSGLAPDTHSPDVDDLLAAVFRDIAPQDLAILGHHLDGEDAPTVAREFLGETD